MPTGWIALVLTASAFGQSFEAALIKAAPPRNGGPLRVGASGGPGSKDPGLFTCENCTVSSLIGKAYELQPYQIAGPASIATDRFNITARVAEGTTPEQFRTMLQNLLTERFGLVFHRERKEVPVYNLVVAKNGSKLAESMPDPPGDSRTSGKIAFDKDGFPVLKGTGISMMTVRGRARSMWPGQSMAELAVQLALQLGKPVTDATRLHGNYDVSLFWVPDGDHAAASDDASLPDLFAAVQEQLGLKLEAARGPVDTVVVDRVAKTPTEN